MEIIWKSKQYRLQHCWKVILYEVFQSNIDNSQKDLFDQYIGALQVLTTLDFFTHGYIIWSIPI